jgi:FkbM family methyltransferase
MLERLVQEKKLKNGLTFSYRVPSSDEAVFGEKSYYVSYTPKEDDIIMDIGANIGDMPLKWGLLAKEIHSYEPMPDTFEILKLNTEKNELHNCKIYEGAVGHGEGDIKIWINLDKHQAHATASSIGKRMKDSLTVRKIDFTEEVKRIQPTVIKIDIEGGEREILENVDDSVFDSCRVFLLEIHPTKWKDGMTWLDQQVERFDKLFGITEKLGEVIYFYKVSGSMWMFTRK